MSLVFASRPPTCLWRRDVWESPAPRPPRPACPRAEVSHGRRDAGAVGQGGEEGGKEGGGGLGDRPGAALYFHFSFRRRRSPGATCPARLPRGEGGLAGLGTRVSAPGAGRGARRPTWPGDRAHYASGHSCSWPRPACSLEPGLGYQLLQLPLLLWLRV